MRIGVALQLLLLAGATAAEATTEAATETVFCTYDLVQEDYAEGTYAKIEGLNYGVCNTQLVPPDASRCMHPSGVS